MALNMIHPESRSYPVTIEDIKKKFPVNTTFEKPFRPLTGYFWVQERDPVYNKLTHSCVEKYPELVNGTWYRNWDIVARDPKELEALLPDEKEKLKTLITAKRWSVETGGMVLPNGLVLNTTSADQNRIGNALMSMITLPDDEVIDFKSSAGFIKITLGEIRALSLAMGRFGQACFTAEMLHHKAVDALKTLEEVTKYDINTGWPNSVPVVNP